MLFIYKHLQHLFQIEIINVTFDVFNAYLNKSMNWEKKKKLTDHDKLLNLSCTVRDYMLMICFRKKKKVYKLNIN